MGIAISKCCGGEENVRERPVSGKNLRVPRINKPINHSNKNNSY